MPNVNLEVGNKIVVTTTRGKELATVLGVNLQKPECQISPFVLEFDRIATQADIDREAEQFAKRDQVLKTAKELVQRCGLEMKLVDAEFTLDGQKTIISFVCDERVDFRDLVKELANALKTRIELKQIGSRDQAQLVGGIGGCGQECCCIRYLGNFDKVSVKMAKTQNLSLNPVKISGICGRLMCCLSYENEHYSETLQRMPKLNSKVTTPSGDGLVIYNNLLKETVNVRLFGDDPKMVEFALADLVFERQNAKPAQEANKESDEVAWNKPIC